MGRLSVHDCLGPRDGSRKHQGQNSEEEDSRCPVGLKEGIISPGMKKNLVDDHQSRGDISSIDSPSICLSHGTETHSEALVQISSVIEEADIGIRSTPAFLGAVSEKESLVQRIPDALAPSMMVAPGACSPAGAGSPVHALIQGNSGLVDELVDVELRTSSAAVPSSCAPEVVLQTPSAATPSSGAPVSILGP